MPMCSVKTFRPLLPEVLRGGAGAGREAPPAPRRARHSLRSMLRHRVERHPTPALAARGIDVAVGEGHVPDGTLPGVARVLRVVERYFNNRVLIFRVVVEDEARVPVHLEGVVTQPRHV